MGGTQIQDASISSNTFNLFAGGISFVVRWWEMVSLQMFVLQISDSRDEKMERYLSTFNFYHWLNEKDTILAFEEVVVFQQSPSITKVPKKNTQSFVFFGD